MVHLPSRLLFAPAKQPRFGDAEEVMRPFSFPRAETPEETCEDQGENVSCSRKCEQTTEPMRGFLRAQGLDERSI